MSDLEPIQTKPRPPRTLPTTASGTSGAHTAGRALSAALQTTPLMAPTLAEATGIAPAYRRARGSVTEGVANFARGLTGKDPLPMPATALAAAPTAQKSTTISPTPAAPTIVAPKLAGGAAASASGTPPNAPVLRTLTGHPGSVAVGRGEFGENVYDNSSIQKMQERSGQIPSAPVGPTTSVATVPTTVPSPVAVHRGLTDRVHGAVIGILGEAERRAEIRRGEIQSDIARLGRGSPTMRRALMDQLAQESGFANEAIRDDARVSAEMALQGQRLNAQTAEAVVQRQLTADQANQDARSRSQEQTSKGRQVTRTLTARDGSTHLLRNDGTVMPVQTVDGQPFREQLPPDGQVTPALRFNALNQQLQAISENVLLKPEEREAMAEPIREQVAALIVQAPQGRPSLTQFLAAARQKGSRMTAQDLTDYYNKTYGATR
ncbi:hypothetical protein ACFOLC_00890 [Lysobacter cavernae]|uniref:Avirulence protein n=1 Tax=Lysobacter cavernae TaxID=1685901 RepID=A0ABV7RP23_9GAMM